MSSTVHTTTLQRREEIARGTMAFHFAKPPGFVFAPGQAIDLVLPSGAGADAAAARHAFSLVSAPGEAELAIATRLRDSAFKNALRALPLGSEVQIDGPFGSLTLHKNPARAAVLIAGGIGITPFMSMLRQAAADRSPQRLLLLYANRHPEDAAFLAELQGLQGRLETFKLLATMTQMAGAAQPWSGATGHIDAALLKRVAGVLPAPIYYLAGPPAMVAAMREALQQAGADSDDVRSEEFFGY